MCKVGKLAYFKLFYIQCVILLQHCGDGSNRLLYMLTLLSFIGWEGWSFEPRATFKRDRVTILYGETNMRQLKLFLKCFLFQCLYSLMYLDKKKNKDFFFLCGQQLAFSLCFQGDLTLSSLQFYTLSRLNTIVSSSVLLYPTHTASACSCRLEQTVSLTRLFERETPV